MNKKKEIKTVGLGLLLLWKMKKMHMPIGLDMYIGASV